MLKDSSTRSEVSLIVGQILFVLIWFKKLLHELLEHTFIHQINCLLLTLSHPHFLRFLEVSALADKAVIAWWITSKRLIHILVICCLQACLKDCLVPININEFCRKFYQAIESFPQYMRVLLQANNGIVWWHYVSIEVSRMPLILVFSRCLRQLRLFTFLIIAQIVCSLNKNTIVVAARNPVLTWMTT